MKLGLFLTIIAISLLSFCGYTVNQSQMKVRALDEFAINSALEVRKYITEKNSCPKTLEGWSKANNYGDYQLEVRHGIMSAFFKCKDDLNYNYVVKYSMDSGIYLSGKGGGDIEITYGHFTEHKKLYIGASPNVKEITNKLHDY